MKKLLLLLVTSLFVLSSCTKPEPEVIYVEAIDLSGTYIGELLFTIHIDGQMGPGTKAGDEIILATTVEIKKIKDGYKFVSWDDQSGLWTSFIDYREESLDVSGNGTYIYDYRDYEGWTGPTYYITETNIKIIDDIMFVDVTSHVFEYLGQSNLLVITVTGELLIE